eukprot:COSAG03_NODE_4997_length_1368_cov_2.350670_2_plen_93_part_00
MKTDRHTRTHTHTHTHAHTHTHTHTQRERERERERERAREREGSTSSPVTRSAASPRWVICPAAYQCNVRERETQQRGEEEGKEKAEKGGSE